MTRQSYRNCQTSNDAQQQIASNDRIIIGNSNARFIDANKVYSKNSCHVIELQNKSVFGAFKFVKGMKIKAKSVVFLVGVNDIHNIHNLVEETSHKLEIPTWKIIVSAIFCRVENRKIDELNLMLKDVCINTGAQLIKLELTYKDFEDDVHLSPTCGVKTLIKAILEKADPIIGVKSTFDHTMNHSNFPHLPNRKVSSQLENFQVTIPHIWEALKNPTPHQN
jgi:hypothetical protein